MTILNWPAELPRPERSTYQQTSQDARQKRQNQNGPPSWRRRFSNAAEMVTLSLVLTRDQAAVFENFFRFDTKLGTLLFWLPDPTTDGWALLGSDGEPLLISGGADDGQPLLLSALWLASFGEQLPVKTVVGVQFRFTFQIVVMP